MFRLKWAIRDKAFRYHFSVLVSFIALAYLLSGIFSSFSVVLDIPFLVQLGPSFWKFVVGADIRELARDSTNCQSKNYLNSISFLFDKGFLCSVLSYLFSAFVSRLVRSAYMIQNKCFVVYFCCSYSFRHPIFC